MLYRMTFQLSAKVVALNVFNHPWTHQVSNVFPPSVLFPLVLFKYLAKHVTGQFRLLILVVSCWIGRRLVGFPQFSTYWMVLFDVSCCKRSCHGCFGRPGVQGSVISALNPLAAQKYVLCRQEFSSLHLSGSGWGKLSIL